MFSQADIPVVQLSMDRTQPATWHFELGGRLSPLRDQGVAYQTLGPAAALSVPTPDHYLPLLYALAVRRSGDQVSYPVEGFDGGSVSMLSVRIG